MRDEFTPQLIPPKCNLTTDIPPCVYSNIKKNVWYDQVNNI